MQVIHTDKAPAAVGPYSQAIAAGDTLYLSGQIAIDPSRGRRSSAAAMWRRCWRLRARAWRMW